MHGAMGDLAAAVDARFFPFNERGTMGDLAAAVDARFFFLFLLFSLSFFLF